MIRELMWLVTKFLCVVCTACYETQSISHHTFTLFLNRAGVYPEAVVIRMIHKTSVSCGLIQNDFILSLAGYRLFLGTALLCTVLNVTVEKSEIHLIILLLHIICSFALSCPKYILFLMSSNFTRIWHSVDAPVSVFPRMQNNSRLMRFEPFLFLESFFVLLNHFS